MVFDKKLEKEGRSRFQIPREELYREMMAFTLANKKVMEEQLRKLGASCDWSRETFTLDERVIKTVCDTFHRLYEDGLAYRGLRVVNWCPKHKTALSDLEVKYVEREDPLYYIKYGPLTLATVRPETKFGDTALAVNPKDKRYQRYIGREIEAEGVLGKLRFKVIADGAVDPDFGTGVVKVTPAHDQTDFEIWQRHEGEIPGPKVVIDEDGRLTALAGAFAGLKVAEARVKVAEAMRAKSILEKVDPTYKHQVATCYKCGSVLEPLPKPQWFIRMTERPKGSGLSLRDAAVRAVQSGKVTFVPKRFEKVFLHWMRNLRNWNISRQIVWGIRIPAWFCAGCGSVRMNLRIKGSWFFMRHGLTDWNVEHRIQGQSGDIPLNEQGRAQALEAARQLKGSGINLVISSTARRARETARIIARELGIEMVTDELLRERSFGVFEGKQRDELDPGTLQDIRYNAAYKPDGGESLHEVEVRVLETLRRHKDTHQHKNILIVSHGAALKSFLHHIKRLSLEAVSDEKLGNASPIHFLLTDACPNCSCDFVEQDPDVLDTWFSSGQWPYATLGYPNHKDYKTFYPTDVMETGWDILFFWVARMMMLGLYRTGKVPFRTVYLHGLVRDKDRQKMSKSKGNVIDPLGVAEQYGTDAVRMALTIGNLPGNNIVISEEKIRGYRNFANKLWNIHRFVVAKIGKVAKVTKGTKAAKVTYSTEDKKQLKELAGLVEKVTRDLETFRFHHAAETIYHYTWHTFANEIIESAKPRLAGADAKERAAAQALLLKIHGTVLKLLHPFMPFITEELWRDVQAANAAKGTKGLLTVEPWPSV